MVFLFITKYMTNLLYRLVVIVSNVIGFYRAGIITHIMCKMLTLRNAYINRNAERTVCNLSYICFQLYVLSLKNISAYHVYFVCSSWNELSMVGLDLYAYDNAIMNSDIAYTLFFASRCVSIPLLLLSTNPYNTASLVMYTFYFYHAMGAWWAMTYVLRNTRSLIMTIKLYVHICDVFIFMLNDKYITELYSINVQSDIVQKPTSRKEVESDI